MEHRVRNYDPFDVRTTHGGARVFAGKHIHNTSSTIVPPVDILLCKHVIELVADSFYREEGAQRDKRSYIKREVDGQCRQGTGKRSIRD